MALNEAPLVAAIEAGGTKIVCGIASAPDSIVARESLPTRDPASTIQSIAATFRQWREQGHEPVALGIGSFGPIDLRVESPDFGRFGKTPKQGWQGVDFVGPLSTALELPVALDTDVNAAALAEQRFGAARGRDPVVYVTVGTGVGVGVVRDGRTHTVPSHPEAGHMRVGRAPDEPDDFAGNCPYHGDCVEGLAAGAAIVARFGAQLGELPRSHPAWRLETEYLARLCYNLTLTLQPAALVIGGGAAQPALLDMLRQRLLQLLAGYEARLATREALEEYLVAPGLGKDAGLLGAMALAQDYAAALGGEQW